MQYKKIKDLYFGHGDAREYQTDKWSDQFQKIYIYDKERISRLISGPVYFVIGDKGTGKTALATYFKHGLVDGVEGVSIFLQKEDFTRFYNFTSSQSEFDSSDYGEMWKAVFSLLLCYIAIEKQLEKDIELDEEAKIFYEKLMKLSFNSFDFSVYSSFKILFSKIKMSSREFLNQEYEDDADFSFYLRAIQSYLDSIFVSINKKCLSDKLFIFIDGLDVRPTEGSANHNTHIVNVTGLINAMYQLNHDGLLSNYSEFFRIIVLVRPDIFEKLELQNVNNIWRTNAIDIFYEVQFKYYRKSELFRIVDTILYTQQDFFPDSNYQLGDCWDHYFPDGLNHYPSDSLKPEVKENAFVGILRNSFNRPRDIIYFMYYWQKISMDNEDCESTYFDPKYTRYHTFKSEYGDYLLGEIRDSLAFYTDVSNYIVFTEFFSQLGNHLNLIERKLKSGVAIKTKDPVFKSEKYMKAHNEFTNYMNLNNIVIPELFLKPELFLQLLYELGLVFYLEEGRTKPIWKTYEDSKNSGDFRPQVRLDGTYRLHRGLIKSIYGEQT